MGCALFQTRPEVPAPFLKGAPAAPKNLEKVSRHVVAKSAFWRAQVIENGLEVVQKIPSYHDEPLTGKQ